ncbi:MAG TPA: tetratricopeptide repeat protein, partial [bacterium]|nr:tetratricopeptide repeat protein [bacterium]
SNLIWEAGRLRLLDFGLAGSHGAQVKAGAGTPAYSPPEAFWGEYGRAGDLFALGVTLYEWLSGVRPFSAWPPAGGQTLLAKPLAQIRPDLPDYLGDLLGRLLELSPSRRPSSALSLIQILRRHGLEEREVETSLVIPSRLAWQNPQLSLQPGKTSLALVGPSGSGRSRWLEERRWEFQLQGGDWFGLTPLDAASWRTLLLRRFYGEKAPLALTDSLSRLLAGGARRAVAFEDFHEWPDTVLREVRLLLEMAEGRADAPLFHFDINSDFETPELRQWRRHFENLTRSQSLELPELSEGQARNLLESAPLEKKPGEEWIRAWLEQSGGRPLLLMEGLRRGAAEDFALEANLSGSAPERLGESARRRIESLSLPARKLFAAFLTRGKALDLAQIAALQAEDDWEPALAELDRHALLRLGPQGQASRRLAQPSLRSLYLSAMSPELARAAHQGWLLHLLKNAPAPEQAGALAAELADHAVALGDRRLAKTWGLAAAEYHENREEPLAALACYQRLLPFAENAEDRYILQGSMAPLFHRLGRYAEAREAYQKWSVDRPDDETRLQKNKFHLFSGMVEYSAGNLAAAREHFESSLKIGPAGHHRKHHPYHARALNFLAALDKRAGKPEAALQHLKNSLELAGEDFVLRGEIEQRWGELEQSLGRFTPAFEHFRRNLELFHQTKNPQSEAVSYHLLGLWAQDYGRLAEAERLMNRSIDLAKAGGAVLQGARYLQNRSLLHLEMARYGEAWESMSQAAKVLRVYGNEEDLSLSQLHRAELHSRLGNPAGAHKLFEALAPKTTEQRPWSAEFLYQRAQHRRRQGEYEKSEVDLQSALKEAESGATLAARIKMAMASLGLAAALGRLGPKSELLHSALGELAQLEGRLYPAWRRSLELWSAEPERLAGLLPPFLAALQELEAPELRRELLANSSLILARRGLKQSAEFLWQKQGEEGRKIAASLSEELKMEYEKNLDGQSLDEELIKILGASSPPPFEKGGPGGDLTAPAQPQTFAPPPPPPATRGVSEQRFRQFSEIARQIAGKTSLAEVLERVMDAAIELTGAERGFLLLENPKSSAPPLPGFEVKTARHFNQQSLGGEELQISMTAVGQAMERGSTLLSANAQLDERLKDKQSVVQYQLKSILAVPLELEGRVLGAIYLDHRYAPDCFREEDVVLLDSFSAQAA